MFWTVSNDTRQHGVAAVQEIQRLGAVFAREYKSVVHEWLKRGDVVAVRFDSANLHGSGLVPLKDLTRLESLYLINTPAPDGRLVLLKGMTRLRKLSLAGTQVSDAGLQHLKQLTSLAVLTLDSTDLTIERMNERKRILPNCHINH